MWRLSDLTCFSLLWEHSLCVPLVVVVLDCCPSLRLMLHIFIFIFIWILNCGKVLECVTKQCHVYEEPLCLIPTYGDWNLKRRESIMYWERAPLFFIFLKRLTEQLCSGTVSLRAALFADLKSSDFWLPAVESFSYWFLLAELNPFPSPPFNQQLCLHSRVTLGWESSEMFHSGEIRMKSSANPVQDISFPQGIFQKGRKDLDWASVTKMH